jgi:hypothetical protein
MFLTTFWEAIAWIMVAAFWLFALALFCWVFIDIFRRRDLSGLGKAGWVLLVFVFPMFGCLIYLVARPKFIDTDVAVAWAPASGSRMSSAEEISYAKQLVEQGTITQAEFEEIKWNALH